MNIRNLVTKEIIEWIICIAIAIILTLLFRYFIATPTVVQRVSMYPTLEENQRLIVTRTFRITKNMPKRGDIVTFEAPSTSYSSGTKDESNPVAIYSNKKRGIFSKFLYNVIEINKISYTKYLLMVKN